MYLDCVGVSGVPGDWIGGGVGRDEAVQVLQHQRQQHPHHHGGQLSRQRGQADALR